MLRNTRKEYINTYSRVTEIAGLPFITVYKLEVALYDQVLRRESPEGTCNEARLRLAISARNSDTSSLTEEISALLLGPDESSVPKVAAMLIGIEY